METNPCCAESGHLQQRRESSTAWVPGLDLQQEVFPSRRREQTISSSLFNRLLRAAQLSVFLFLLVTQLCWDLVAVAVSGCLAAFTLPLGWKRKPGFKGIVEKVRPNAMAGLLQTCAPRA